MTGLAAARAAAAIATVLALGFGAEPAAAACPTAATTPNGFVLSRGEKTFIETVLPASGDIVRAERLYEKDGRLRRVESQFLHGVSDIKRTAADGTIVTTYHTDPAGLFPLGVGSNFRSDQTITFHDGRTIEAEFELTVMERASVSIAERSYETLLVKQVTRVHNGPESVFWNYYSPELRYILATYRMSETTPRKPLFSVLFDRISTEAY